MPQPGVWLDHKRLGLVGWSSSELVLTSEVLQVLLVGRVVWTFGLESDEWLLELVKVLEFQAKVKRLPVWTDQPLLDHGSGLLSSSRIRDIQDREVLEIQLFLQFLLHQVLVVLLDLLCWVQEKSLRLFS